MQVPGHERFSFLGIPAAVLIIEANHAKDKKAAAFYRHHAFMALADAALTVFLPLALVL